MSANKVLVSWSAGKDSAYALYQLKTSPEFKDFHVVGLFSTLCEAYDRVSMHGVRRALLEAQAKQLNLPLFTLLIPYPCSNELYQSRMQEFLSTQIVPEGITHIAFGDIFLKDVRKYREEMLRHSGIKPLFPLWGQDTKKLAQEIIASGIKAKITCLDMKKLAQSFLGHDFDEKFLAALPHDIDPCAEHGEFHTFVYASPLFKQEIAIATQEVVERDGCVFVELQAIAGV